MLLHREIVPNNSIQVVDLGWSLDYMRYQDNGVKDTCIYYCICLCIYRYTIMYIIFIYSYLIYNICIYIYILRERERKSFSEIEVLELPETNSFVVS